MNSKNSTIIFFFGILIIGAITNPSYDDHKREVTKAIIPETEIDANDPWGTLGQSLGSRMAGGLLDKYFSVSNYVVLSVGRIKYQGNKKTASIGFLGNVIAFDSNDAIPKNSSQSKRKTSYEKGFKLNDNYKSQTLKNDIIKTTGDRLKKSAEKVKEEARQKEFNEKSKQVLIFESDRFKVSCEQNYIDGELVAVLELENLTFVSYKSVWFELKAKNKETKKQYKKRIRFPSVPKLKTKKIEVYIYDEIVDIDLEFSKTT